MIEITGLRKTYRMGDEEVAALGGVDLFIGRGEHVAVIGPSGSGKSTLMNIVGGLDRPDGGAYRFEGEEVAGFDDDELPTSAAAASASSSSPSNCCPA